MNATTVLNNKAQEPNPFEQSFSSATSPLTSKFNQYSPPNIVGDNTNHGGIVDIWVSNTSSYSYDSNSVNNDTYSVSDHQATSTSEDSNDAFNNMNNNNNPIIYEFEQQRPKRHNSNSTASTNYGQQQQYQYHAQFINNNNINYKSSSRQQSTKGIKKRTRTVKLPEDEEKRKNFLERNRLAALKCRQRKKQWLSNLQARVEYLANDNDQLQMETDALRKEIMDLKTLLVAHKDCPQYSAALAANNAPMPQQHLHQQPVYRHDFTMTS